MDFGVFTLSQSPSQLNDLGTIARRIRGASENRRHCAAGWRRLSSSVAKMVLSQNPSASNEVEIMVGLLGKVADADDALSKSELRAAEDLRDIVERYDVICRCNEAYSEASNIFDSACLELNAAVADDRENSDRPNYAATKFKYQAAIEKAKDDKRHAIARFKAAVARIIEMRERYATFRVRRMTHAWQTLGAALTVWATAERPLFVELKSALREWRKGAVVSEGVIATVEERVAADPQQERTLLPVDEPPAPVGAE